MPKYSYKKKTSHMKRNILIALASLIVIGGVLFALEKTDVINLYGQGKTPADVVSDEKGVNEVDYSPANSTDNDDINAKKESGEIDQTPTPPTNDTSVQITYIAADQAGISGGTLEIRMLLNGVTNGNCFLTLSKGSKTVNKSAAVVQQNNIFTCDGFNIPYSELENGEWQSTIKVTTDDGRSNEASTQITIN